MKQEVHWLKTMGSSQSIEEYLMNGVLFINKESGLTSRDVVNKICKIYHTKKVGHTGTLDPLATGVLVVCLGSYTKLVSQITAYEKEYIATMKLGILTDTGDVTGKIIKRDDKYPSEEKIRECFAKFPKEYLQTVPKYSAVKVNGKKLYEYARENIAVSLPKRQVQIKNLEILDISKDEITFQVCVSKGTYIRSLIEDLAKEMETVATMSFLKRTKQGNISLEECVDVNDLKENYPLKTIENLFNYPKVKLDDVNFERVKNGNKLSLEAKDDFVFVTYEDQIVGLYKKDADIYRFVFKTI